MNKVQDTTCGPLRVAARASAVALALLLGAGAAQAAVIRFVVPYAAGGVSDQAARIVAERMATVLGETIIVDNKPGAGSKLGTLAVAQAAADGNTLLFTNISFSTLPLVDKTARLDPINGFAPVGLVATYGAALVVNSALPVSTLQDLITYAKARPGKLSYGSAGQGSGAHFVGEYFKVLTGSYVVHIPYRSTAGALNDVAGGQIDMAIDATAKPMVDAGKVKALAIVGSQRDPRLPTVPTAAEAGVKGLDFDAWLGLLAPPGTPPATVERLNKALNSVLQEPGVRRQFEAMGLIPRGGAPERLTQQLRADAVLYRKVIEQAKLSFDTN